MKASIVIIICFCCTTISCASKNDSINYFHKNNYYDLGFAFGNNEYSEALSWSHLHSFGKRKRIKIGYGLRFTNFNSTNKQFTTAPAKYTSAKENIDTLTFQNTQTSFLNFNIQLQYSFHKFDFNFNIDVVGLSYLQKATGYYSQNAEAANKIPNAQYQRAGVSPTNILLTGDNDIGSLNSEFSVRYWINKKIAIRAGFCFLFTEYTTENKLRLDNDRFRYKSKLALIAITYSPFHY